MCSSWKIEILQSAVGVISWERPAWLIQLPAAYYLGPYGMDIAQSFLPHYRRQSPAP